MTSAEIDAGALNARGLTDPGLGAHLWTTMAAFGVSDAALAALDRGETPGVELLGAENLLRVEGPGCFKCGESYTVRTARRTCFGHMMDDL